MGNPYQELNGSANLSLVCRICKESVVAGSPQGTQKEYKCSDIKFLQQFTVSFEEIWFWMHRKKMALIIL